MQRQNELSNNYVQFRDDKIEPQMLEYISTNGLTAYQRQLDRE